MEGIGISGLSFEMDRTDVDILGMSFVCFLNELVLGKTCCDLY